MAERKLVIQSEDLQMAVAKVLDLIKSRYEKQESLLQNCKRLALFSPVVTLWLNFCYKSKDITFLRLCNLKLENKEEQLTYDHLWKVSDGYALVHDRIALIAEPGGKFVNNRTITLLDDGLHDSGKRCLQDKLISNVAICNQEISPPEKSLMPSYLERAQLTESSNQVEIDEFSDSSLSDSLSDSLTNTLDGESGDENTPVDNCKLSSDWLIDFDNPPLHIPALEAEKRQSVEAKAVSTTMKWKSARVIESREEAIQSREAHLDEIERDITARVAELQARESDLNFHEQEFNTRLSAVMTRENDMEIRGRELLASWTQYNKLYSEIQKFKIDLKDREFDLDQRECRVEQREAANTKFEEVTRAKMTAELKCRILDAESLEESIAIRNLALKEREERLDEREQLAVVDKKALEVKCARIAFRMDQIKIHEDVVKDSEIYLTSRENEIINKFEAREALVEKREAAFKLREYDAMQNYSTFLSPEGPIYTALRHVKQKQTELSSEMMARELAVLEREQKVAASEAALKLERDMIRVRFRDTEETKNQEIAECVVEEKK
ncbi:hypothetical protein BGAL_0085g00110 [Botrytis galanthina]|uniref:Uncharacterized protein n=1 Tax=Botrytis galanthina TaxID=278940 RepID=A0A4S8R549_9HELO|nr:hypothetical protein BGAL_0085g00110 [Botrytis galanthina]